MSRKDSRSRFLSLILRHKPETIGITLDSNGWADVNELLRRIAIGDSDFTMSVLEDIVKTDSKMRYSFNEDKTKIRANQGHSVNVDVELKVATPPDILYHGTCRDHISSIMTYGVMKMGRLHVHLTDNYDTAIKVGSRYGSPVVLRIHTSKMVEDGYKFYKSENGVWLVDYVPQQYLTAIRNHTPIGNTSKKIEDTVEVTVDGTKFVNKEMLIKWLDLQRPLLKDDSTEEYESEHKYEYGKLRMIEKTKRLLQHGDDWKDLDTAVDSERG